MKPIGTEVGFQFTAFRVTLSEPYVVKRGRGIVVANDDYSVWPCPGYAIRVTESSDYAAGEIVKVSTVNVRP